jgi:hypothetical protein
VSTTASFEQQVAIWLETFRDRFDTAASARAYRDQLAQAAEGETVFIGSSHEGGAASSQVVRDKLGQMSALNHLILELTNTASTTGTETRLPARSLMTYPDYSGATMQT